MVKVLDFGLAKALEGDAGSDPSEAPTRTAAPTRAGVIMGTAAYMSPEQARGNPLDKRTDIWSFGCVLYEVLAARRAFGGTTVPDTLAAIIEREPAWDALPSQTPSRVRDLLRRCLHKRATQRLRDIGDALFEIEDALAPTIPGDAAPPTRPSVNRVPWFVALAAVLGAVGVAVWNMSGTAAVDPTADLLMERVTYDTGLTGAPALAPDGQLLAHASDRAGEGHLDIWVQQPSGGTPLRLTDHPADDYSPHFSPDGSEIVFRSDRDGGGAYIVSALGGEPRLLAREARRPRFSPDGERVAYWTGLFRGNNSGFGTRSFVVPLGGGTPVPVLEEFVGVRDPVWSPDNDALLILGGPRLRPVPDDSLDWWWVPLDDRPAVKTGAFDHAGLRAALARPSYWSSMGVGTSDGSNLWVVPLDPTTGRLSGSPRQLTRGVSPHTTPTTSRDGQIAFFVSNIRRVVERVPLGGAGEQRPTRLYADSRTDFARTSQTSDGNVIVFERAMAGGREIWLRNILTGEERLITRVQVESSPSARVLSATVSPDGSVVAYTLDQAGYLVETSGGVPRRLCDACGLFGFLSDNRRVLAILAMQDGGLVARLIDHQTGTGEDILVVPDGRLSRPHASPDDRWLAFGSGIGTGVKSFVVPLSPGHPPARDQWVEVQEPTTTGRPDGRSIPTSSTCCSTATAFAVSGASASTRPPVRSSAHHSLRGTFTQAA